MTKLRPVQKKFFSAKKVDAVAQRNVFPRGESAYYLDGRRRLARRGSGKLNPRGDDGRRQCSLRPCLHARTPRVRTRTFVNELRR